MSHDSIDGIGQRAVDPSVDPSVGVAAERVPEPSVGPPDVPFAGPSIGPAARLSRFMLMELSIPAAEDSDVAICVRQPSSIVLSCAVAASYPRSGSWFTSQTSPSTTPRGMSVLNPWRLIMVSWAYAIQDELGVAGANGNYGPGTRAAVAAQPNITVGSSDAVGHYWVRLFQAALRFNTYDASFTGTFTSADSSIVFSFQAFCLLTVNGQGDYEAWSSLLVSNGDPTRNGKAADCASEVISARASALVADGRVAVGRYLTNVEGSTLNKKIQPGELSVILGAGLRVFPIFQTLGDTLSYFSDAQ